MGYEEILKILFFENSKIVSEEALRLLSKIAENILKDPSNSKLRTLQKNNTTVSNKVLSAKGAVDCLKYMGFQENHYSFFMPLDVPLVKLQQFQNEIRKWKNHIEAGIATTNTSNTKEIKTSHSYIKKIELPPLVFIYTNPFLRSIEKYFHNVLQYEDKNIQERARNLIPILICEERAQIKLRSIQELVKKGELKDLDISVQDTLIPELLRWFKEEFFSWVDNPSCSQCNGETTFSHMSSEPKQFYSDRIELHKCKTCNQLTPFPRYNDLNILLETRRGRCGEWANTFTLFCRSMGWDARFVVDEGDHVWTEVYSIAQKRWLHCDPCENICDTPLMYENGWHKNISYVIAYSADEVQDVTWRYTSNHKKVLTARNKCSEAELLDALFKLRTNRQKKFSESRRKYLTKRLLNELVEFLTEKKPGTEEQKGRTSGSAVWRLLRGEIQNTVDVIPFTWHIRDDEIIDNQVTLKYCTSLDKYVCTSGNNDLLQINKWNEGALDHSGIFRKEEKDWKVAYLARREGHELGKISWQVEVVNSSKLIDTLVLNFNHATFENGKVSVEISFGDKQVLLPDGESVITVREINSSSLTITASLSEGTGNVAWQHAQLFRQSMDSSEFPFNMTLTFKYF